MLGIMKLANNNSPWCMLNERDNISLDLPHLEGVQVELRTHHRLACMLKLGICLALKHALSSHTPQATNNPAY